MQSSIHSNHLVCSAQQFGLNGPIVVEQHHCVQVGKPILMQYFLFISILSGLSRSNLTTSLCPSMQAIIPLLTFKSILGSKWSKSNLTTSLCPLEQANINTVLPTFVSLLSHASKIFPFYLLFKTFSSSSFQVCDTSRKLTNPGVSVLSKISSPTCGIPRLFRVSLRLFLQLINPSAPLCLRFFSGVKSSGFSINALESHVTIQTFCFPF